MKSLLPYTKTLISMYSRNGFGGSRSISLQGLPHDEGIVLYWGHFCPNRNSTSLYLRTSQSAATSFWNLRAWSTLLILTSAPIDVHTGLKIYMPPHYPNCLSTKQLCCLSSTQINLSERPLPSGWYGRVCCSAPWSVCTLTEHRNEVSTLRMLSMAKYIH